MDSHSTLLCTGQHIIHNSIYSLRDQERGDSSRLEGAKARRANLTASGAILLHPDGLGRRFLSSEPSQASKGQSAETVRVRAYELLSSEPG